MILENKTQCLCNLSYGILSDPIFDLDSNCSVVIVIFAYFTSFNDVLVQSY